MRSESKTEVCRSGPDIRFPRVRLLLAAATALGLALVPMAQDEVIYDGPAGFTSGTWSYNFALLSARPAGLYLGVAGVERFQVFLNDSLLAAVQPGPTPRTLLRAIDLSAWAGMLRPGDNRLTLVMDVIVVPADSFAVRFWASPHSWYLGSSHSHSVYSDGELTVRELMEWASRDGAWFFGITDHNTLDQCADPAFRRFGLCEPMRGTEWTVDSGHANLMGIQGQDPVPTGGSVHRMIDEGKYRGAMVHINHPFSPDHRWRRAPVLDPGIDGIELLNGRMNRHEIEEPAIQWWHSLLVAGHAIPSLSSSDFHHSQWEHPLKPCVRVRATSNHPDTLLRAFKLGRVMSCDRHDGSRLYLYADTSLDGQWDLAMGDNVIVGNGSRAVRFRVEAESVLQNEEVIVLNRNGELLRVRFDQSGDFSHEWTSLVFAGDSGFVRAELRRANGRAAALTNPIYINSPGYRFGPTELRSRAVFLRGTSRPGELESDPSYVRLEIKLENHYGYSPYEFGLAVALDTADWRVVSRQRQGPGVGVVRKTRMKDHHVLTWHGGYQWGIRLRPGESVAYWVELQAKRAGECRVLTRSWANDRLFDTAADPDSGLLGPDGHQWHQYMVETRAADVKIARAGYRFGDRLAVSGPTLARDRILLAVDMPGPGPLELRVYDHTGRRRLTRRFSLQPGPARPVEIELAGPDRLSLPAGVYFLRLDLNDESSGENPTVQTVMHRLLVVE